jgi:hypothetical protein
MKTIMTCRYAFRFGTAFLLSGILCDVTMPAQNNRVVHVAQTPQAQLNTLATQLNLIQVQMPQVKAILVDANKKMTDLRNSGGDLATRRSQMTAIRTNEQTQIEALLTGSQKTKYEAMISAQQNP